MRRGERNGRVVRFEHSPAALTVDVIAESRHAQPWLWRHVRFWRGSRWWFWGRDHVATCERFSYTSRPSCESSRLGAPSAGRSTCSHSTETEIQHAAWRHHVNKQRDHQKAVKEQDFCNSIRAAVRQWAGRKYYFVVLSLGVPFRVDARSQQRRFPRVDLFLVLGRQLERLVVFVHVPTRNAYK